MSGKVLSVAALMPAYNSENTIREALHSLIHQTHQLDEIVVVDDGSTDATGEIVTKLKATSKHPIIKYYRTENSGVGAALRYGLSKINTDLVMRLDADDIAVPDRLEKQIKIILQGYDVVGSWAKAFGLKEYLIEYPAKHYQIASAMDFRCAFCHPAVLARTEVLDYKDERKEDYALWLRLLREGKRFYNVQEALVFYRVSEGQQSKKDRIEMPECLPRDRGATPIRDEDVARFVWKHLLGKPLTKRSFVMLILNADIVFREVIRWLISRLS